MYLNIPYRENQSLSLEVPTEGFLGVFEPNTVRSPGAKAVLKAALGPQSGLVPFLKGANKLLIIINDATRPTPTPAMLDVLMPILHEQGIHDEQLTILVATGAHRPVLERELGQLLGSYAQQLKQHLSSHVAKDGDSLVYIGETRNKTPIFLNKLLFESDRIIATGSVEPHYFAGYTGGRKAFLPGIAGFETIEANHKLALQKEAHSLKLDGNPVHDDMMDALTYIQAPIFSLMTVLDKDQRIVGAASGDIVESFKQAVQIARSVFCVTIPQKADIVLSIAKFPMDINLYQSQKAIDNGARAVKDGGTLILVASCREGIGDEEFAKLLGSCKTPDEALEKIQHTYKLGYHKAAKMAAVCKRMTVQAYTDLADEQLSSLFIEPIHDLAQALEQARQRAKRNGVENPTLLVLGDGCVTVPTVG